MTSVLRQIFLSTVTNEFGEHRKLLRADLSLPSVKVQEQDDFIQGGGKLLQTLDDYIRDYCHAVIHLVGSQIGQLLKPDEVRWLLETYPSFTQRFDFLANELSSVPPSLSYTQLEVWLALFHGKRCHIYRPSQLGLQPLPNDHPQQMHWNRIRALGEHRGEFSDIADLRIRVLRDLHNLWPTDIPKLNRPINLPYPSLGTLFKGREQFLDDLRKRLAVSKTGVAAIAVRPQTLFGAGGIGKSRTAIEYAWRNSEHYSALLFLSASSPEALASSLANLIGVLRIEGMEGANDDVRLQAVLEWLQTHPGWLAILDNVDDDVAAQAVKARLSALSAGHVLITSRLSTWSGAVEKLELDLLTVDAASDYLMQAAGQRTERDNDLEQAETLALKIGLLALGLEHAAAYINARAWSFAEYLQQWDQDEESILEEFDLSQIDYPRELLITWRLSVDRLDSEARKLLDILSWLASQPLSELTFDALESSEVNHLRSALNLLVKYSLLKRDTLNGVRVYTQHQLVQATTRCHQRNRQEGKSEIRLPRLVSALDWMNRACTGSPQDVRNWPKLDPLVPHLLAVCQFANREEKNSAEHATADLLNGTGMLLHYKAQHREAEPLLRQSLEICEKSCGPEHPKVAIRLNNLALLLQATNRLPAAEPLLRRALKIDEKSYGPEHPEVATDLNNLALLLQATNRLPEAEPLMRRALEIDEKSYGPEHPDVARDLNNLTQLLWVTNRLFEAEPLMARVVSILESSFGVNHPNVAIALNNQASLLKAANRLSEAELLLRRAVTILEVSFGANHPNVATTVSNLALLLQDTNRLFEAEPLTRQVVLIYIKFAKSTGHEHPYMLAEIANYRTLLEDLGNSEFEIDQAIAGLLK